MMPILFLVLKAISILYMNLCYMINDAIAKQKEKEKEFILPLTIQYDHTVRAAQRYKNRYRIHDQPLEEIVITV